MLLGAVVVRERPALRPHAAVPVTRLRPGHPDMCQLQVGISDPRYGVVLDLGRQAEERVPNNDPRMISRHMGELVTAGDIADGEDLLVGGAKPRIDFDSARRELNIRRLEIQALDIGAPARGD